MEAATEIIFKHFNFWVYVILMMIGLYAMITKNNLIKKLIGMSIFQTAIILFFVSLGVKTTGGIPILEHHGHHGETEHVAEAHDMVKDESGVHEEVHPEETVDIDSYANPLPHVLMLTAIVVGVATLGVALAICQFIYKGYGTLEENEILEKIREAHHG